MKRSIKRKIAKEIIIFFSSIVFIILTLTILWGINQSSISNKTGKLQTQISNLKHRIDSMQLSFPKTMTFDEMIVLNKPLDYHEVRDNSTMKISSNPNRTISETNIRKLYNLLSAYKYRFSNDFSGWIPTEVYVEKIQKEFTLNFSEKIELRKVYDFLKDQKSISIEFDQFVFNLEGYPLPPPYDSWIILEKYKKQKDELNSKLSFLKSKVYSASDLLEIAKWISIIIFVLIYPFRFIAISLMWAFKTMKQE